MPTEAGDTPPPGLGLEGQGGIVGHNGHGAIDGHDALEVKVVEQAVTILTCIAVTVTVCELATRLEIDGIGSMLVVCAAGSKVIEEAKALKELLGGLEVRGEMPALEVAEAETETSDIWELVAESETETKGACVSVVAVATVVVGAAAQGTEMVAMDPPTIVTWEHYS